MSIISSLMGQMGKPATNAANTYQAFFMCWVLYCAIPYVI